MLPVTITSNCFGLRTSCIAALSTYMCDSATSGYSLPSARHDLAPQDARVEHVGLVDRAQAACRACAPPRSRRARCARSPARCSASCRSLRRRPSRIAPPPARLAEVDVAGELAHDQEVEAGDDLRLERRRGGELRIEQRRPQVGEQRQRLADAQQALLGTQLARQRVVLRTADRAQQDRVGRLRERERRRRAADRPPRRSLRRRSARSRLERQALVAQERRARAAPAATISGPMPSPGRMAIFIFWPVHKQKAAPLLRWRRSSAESCYANQGFSASRFVSNARIASACSSVRPMSSRPFSRQCLRNGSTSKPNASEPSAVRHDLPLEVDRELEAREARTCRRTGDRPPPRAARSAAGRSCSSC